MRSCSKQGCSRGAAGTLTYDYKGQTVVLGPLASVAEPHTYDICEHHMESLTVPKGWDVVRLEVNYEVSAPSDDDLMELAEAVKEAAKPRVQAHSTFTAFAPPPEQLRPQLEVVSGDSSKTVEPALPEGPGKRAERPSLGSEVGPFASPPRDTSAGS